MANPTLDTVSQMEDPETLSEKSQGTVEATHVNARPEMNLFINNVI